MQSIKIALGPYSAASANSVALAQTVAGGGAFAINGAAAVSGTSFARFDNPRAVSITSSGNDSANVFTVEGTDANGSPIGVQIAGTNAGVATTPQIFSTISAVRPLIATAGNVTVGSAAFPYHSRPVRMDDWVGFPTIASVVVSGTVTYQVEYSNDFENPVNWTQASLGPTSANGDMTFPSAPRWLRISITAGTGGVVATITQTGMGV